jgi:hypothetical protein
MMNEEPKMCTTSGRPVDEVRAEQTEKTGQHKDYIVLCPDERAKGFVRPYRDKYIHSGRKVCGAFLDPQHIRDTKEFWEICAQEPGHAGACGSPFFGDLLPSEAKQIHSSHTKGGCGVETKMGQALSETYARDPKFYGATFCVGCNRHLPVGEFVWSADGEVVGS